MKRDSAYYKDQLAKRFPPIFDDLKSGKYTSVRAAAIAAGLIKVTTPTMIARRGWKKMSPAERKDFIRWGLAELTAAADPGKSTGKKSKLTDA